MVQTLFGRCRGGAKRKKRKKTTGEQELRTGGKVVCEKEHQGGLALELDGVDVGQGGRRKERQ